MRSRFRPTPAMVVACIALFVALGGTATAVTTYVVSSNSQIGPNTVSGHKPPSGKHANVIAGSINGQDIADNSGVETCKSALTKKFGPICAGSDGVSRTWGNALHYCAAHGLRLPNTPEAVVLAENHDVPGVNSSQQFWTDEEWDNAGVRVAAIVDENDLYGAANESDSNQTVCVTDPSA